jgi:hypothetical protein
VFCSEPAFGLPTLPGELVGRVDAATPVMVGEFSDDAGGAYVMLVNLSLERSVKAVMTLAGESAGAEIASVDDGVFRPVKLEGGLWLTPGQGVLLRL